MKKTITAVTAIFIVGFFAVSAYAWGCGNGPGAGMRGYGQRLNDQSAVNQEDVDAFFKETQALRASLSADRAELSALMAGTNPDPKRARALSENISKTQSELRAKAQPYNISCPMGGPGYGPGEGYCGGRQRNHAARCW
ncbi:periplasmic heavy metal sensor [Desulfobacter postgatei]|jgi:Spy/CpxP family protein refolding chaperone|uniref:Spy/CpxP family protein refolding chaperone n=1 Tax=Desulfobacter postgatei TaxID=2293 RepID=UPI002A370108|nr:periplasmic heavy metal sensor [Desulfobacter postgatei]MDX9964826.1 periplasmic heavy metal sensor [Desulfobacter postgatei]